MWGTTAIHKIRRQNCSAICSLWRSAFNYLFDLRNNLVSWNLDQAFKFLFTSPTFSAEISCNTTGPQPEDLPPWKRSRKTGQATHCNIANIIGLQSITPCAIAYTAVQVMKFFALTSDHSCITVLSSYVLIYLVPAHGTSLTWISITKNFTTPLLIILKLRQGQLQRPSSTSFLRGGTSVYCLLITVLCC